MDVEQRLLNLLGLARKAGKLQWGKDTVIRSLLRSEAKLVLTASDFSPNAASRIKRLCTDRNCRYLPLVATQEDLARRLGVLTGVLTVTDIGFATSMQSLADTRRDEPATRKDDRNDQ